jgi:hypothetical protein
MAIGRRQARETGPMKAGAVSAHDSTIGFMSRR